VQPMLTALGFFHWRRSYRNTS